MEKIETLVTRDEIRRLEKAAKEKDKHKLLDWMSQFEEQLIEKLKKEFLNEYEKQLGRSIDNYMTAIVFALHFSELTHFDDAQVKEFVEDISATIELFTLKEETPISYMERLKEEGITYFNELLEERKKNG